MPTGAHRNCILIKLRTSSVRQRVICFAYGTAFLDQIWARIDIATRIEILPMRDVNSILFFYAATRARE